MHSRRSFLRASLAASSAILADALGAPGTKKIPPPIPIAARQKEPVIFLEPGDPGYGRAREIYNAAITTQPKLIARCASEAGVQEALRRAAEQKLGVAVKSGGHSFEGFCLNDDGLVIDAGPFQEMRLDRETGILTAGAGCRLGEINRFLLARGRFLPSGSCESVGLTGLTLGGGYGMFARKWGLTCDHLRSVRMVDGTGKIRDSHDEPDLLWACRGGGNGHFGIVTQLTLQTRAAPPLFSAWKFRTYKLEAKRAAVLLEAWFAASAGLPREAFSAWVMNGSQVTILLTTIGSREQQGLAAFRKKMSGFSNRTTSGGPAPLTKALPWYYANPGPIFFKNASAGFYRGMDDLRGALPGVFEEVLNVPGLIFQVNTLGGAIAEGEGGAYPHRAFPYLGERQAYWEKPEHAARCIAAAGRMGESLAKAGITRHYANYPDLAFKEWPTAYYGEGNYRQLQKLKALYDPENRLRHPQSVRLAEA